MNGFKNKKAPKQIMTSRTGEQFFIRADRRDHLQSLYGVMGPASCACAGTRLIRTVQTARARRHAEPARSVPTTGPRRMRSIEDGGSSRRRVRPSPVYLYM